MFELLLEKMKLNKNLEKPVLKLSLCFLLLLMLNAGILRAQLTPAWVQRYTGPGDNSDRYNALATDAAGNFYLAGYSYRNGNQKDFLVVKTDANGDTLWVRTINGSNAGDDEANAVRVDDAGNVFATGYTDGGNSNLDFLTVKYSASGTLIWSRIYNNALAYHDDVAVAMALDSAANIYVTGISDQSITTASNNDYATVKYDSSGNEIFAALKNGFGNDKDEAVAVVADNNGNCYVTGRSDSGSDDDYITIKYNGTGTVQWTKLYDGGNGDDRAAGLVLTPAGEIVVTGRADAGSDDNIVTICYSAAGTQMWLKSFNGSASANDRPSAISTDASGNIFIAGQSDADPSFSTNYDFVTVKYSSTGTFQWASYKAGSGGGEDSPEAITTDANGNVFTAGRFDADITSGVNDDMMVVKYDAGGSEQWSRTVSGTSGLEDRGDAILVDLTGNPVIAGKIDNTGPQQDAMLVKYDQAGNQVFIKEFNGDGDFSDNANVIRLDPSGNVFIAGYTFITGHNRDLLVKKYDNNGNPLQEYLYNGSKSDEDEVADMVIDAAGNVYITGHVKNSGASSDIVTIKFNNNLDTSWVRFYNYTANESDKGVSIALDGNNNVYVTGYSDNNPSDTIDSDDMITMKYDNNGGQQWAMRYNSLANGDDKAVKVMIDQSGNVDIAGTSWNGSSKDITLVQYSSSGSQQWVSSYNGISNGDDEAEDMTVDNSGNIYVTGSGLVTGNLNDYVILKYNQGGGQHWARTYNGTGNDEDYAHAIALDDSNNVYVTGQSDVDISPVTKNYDYVTLKYNNAGDFQWFAGYAGDAGTDDVAGVIQVDPSGNIYVGGQSENGTAGAPDKDYAVVRYNRNGIQDLYAVYNGPVSGTDGANAICLDATALYVTGNSNGGSSHKDVATIKYDIPVGILEPGHVTTASFAYPNPASSSVSLVLNNLPANVSVMQTDIFDISGRRVKSFLTNGKGLRFDIEDLESGCYFYLVRSSDNLVASGNFIKE